MNNVALITGASSGIGKEFAIIHAEKGGDLVLVARNEAGLQKVKSELEEKYGVQAIIIAKDLSKPGSATDLYNEVKQAGVEVTYLINNAGFGGQGKFYERSWEEDESMINLNVTALAELTRKFLPEFVAKNEGKVLNVSSTASLMPGPLQAVYFATKAFVTSFSLALTEELRGTNVTVTVLLPGATKTAFFETAGMGNSDLAKNLFGARDVALAGYEAMLAGKREVIAGVTFSQRMLMKLIPFLPKGQLLKQVKKIQEVK